MKKTSFLHFLHAAGVGCMLLASTAFTACVNDAESEINSPDSDIRNQYTKAWIEAFSLIDPNQDWCTLTSVSATLDLPADAAQTFIYNDDPVRGGHLIASASTSRTLKLDMPKGATRIYARTIDAKGYTLSRGYYPIIASEVVIAGNPMPAPSRAGDDVQYAHDPSYFDAMLICEDLGSIGDFDFNDIVIGLKHVSGDDPKLTIVPMAAGGTLAADIYFGDSYMGEIHDMIKHGAPTDKTLNTTVKNIGSVTNLPHLEIPLDAPEYNNWTIADNWGDIKIKVTSAESTVTITRPTTGTAPQMICLGGDWFWPQERADIRVVYSGFKTWSCNAGALTWFGNWLDSKVVKWSVPDENPDLPIEKEKMWIKVTTSDNSDYLVRFNGTSSAEFCSSGEKYYFEDPLTSFADMFAVYSTTQAFIMQPDGSFQLASPVVENNITSIEFSSNFDLSLVTSFAHAFDGCKHLTSINIDAVEKKPTAALADVSAMFHYCESLTALDLSGWDTSGVTSYFDAFGYCSALATLNLDGWSIRSGANLRRIFGNTSGLTVKCSAALQSALTSDSTTGGTGTSYTRP